MSDVLVAVNEDVFRILCDQVLSKMQFAGHLEGQGGRLRPSCDFSAQLQGGSIDLRADGDISVEELDVIWNRLDVELDVDIPEKCVGGQCIVKVFGRCIVRLPRVCVFSANPDVRIPLKLGPIIRRSEISMLAVPEWKRNEIKPDDFRWQLFLKPTALDFDLIDIADVVADLLQAIFTKVIDDLLGWLPGPVRDVIRWLLGGLVALIRFVLDIPDDFLEWLMRLLKVSLGVFNFVLTLIAQHFSSKFPLHEIQDPYPILDADGALPAITVPITSVVSQVNDRELILEANYG